jgi:hypothetical protein
MIERKDKVLQKEILIGFIITLILTAISIKSNPTNTSGVQIGNIGLPTGAVDTLRKILGH